MSCPEKELRELERRHARRIADEYYKIHPDAFALRLPDMHKLTPEQEHLYHSVAAKIKTEVEERALFPSTHEKRKNHVH